MWPWTAERVRRAVRAFVPTPADAPFPEPLASREIHGTVIDSRKVVPGCLFVAVPGERFDGHDFVAAAFEAGAVLALVETSWKELPALPAALRDRCIVVPDTTLGLRALAGAFRQAFSFPVFGVGGSNGKTTTKEMLAALLAGADLAVTRTEKSENGFLGVAVTLTQKAHATVHPPAALVLEIGIDTVGAMKEHVDLCTPEVVLLTALGPEHLAGLGTWENAVREEFDLFTRGKPRTRVWQLEEAKLRERVSFLNDSDVLVGTGPTLTALPRLPAGCARVRYDIVREGATTSRVRIAWSPGAGTGGVADSGFARAGAFEAEYDVALPGRHNAANFALAAAAALAAGAARETLARGVERFVAPAMRSRVVDLPGDVVLYDDSYNASPSSFDAALDALCSPEWAGRAKALVLGDMLDLGDESRKWHLALADRLAAFPCAALCLYGDAMYDVFRRLEEDPASRKNFVTLKWLSASADPCAWVQDVLTPLRNAVVLVKGSRGTQLDRVVHALERGNTPA